MTYLIKVMLRQRLFLFLAIVAIVLDVYLFRTELGLRYIRLPFVVIALFYLASFYDQTCKIFSESEAKRLDRKIPGVVRHYKANEIYLVESIVSIILLLIPLSVLLFTMMCNQQEIAKVGLLTQSLIAAAGFGLLHLIKPIFSIGPTHQIGYSAAEVLKKDAEERRRQKQARIRQEAKELIDGYLPDLLGLDRSEVAEKALLCDQLGFDEFDLDKLMLHIDKYLNQHYDTGEHVPHLPPFWVINDEKIHQYDQFRIGFGLYDPNNEEQHAAWFEGFTKLFPTVGDLYHFVEQLMAYYGRFKK